MDTHVFGTARGPRPDRQPNVPPGARGIMRGIMDTHVFVTARGPGPIGNRTGLPGPLEKGTWVSTRSRDGAGIAGNHGHTRFRDRPRTWPDRQPNGPPRAPGEGNVGVHSIPRVSIRSRDGAGITGASATRVRSSQPFLVSGDGSPRCRRRRALLPDRTPMRTAVRMAPVRRRVQPHGLGRSAAQRARVRHRRTIPSSPGGVGRAAASQTGPTRAATWRAARCAIAGIGGACKSRISRGRCPWHG
jgi:hypothetical protein